MVDTFTERFLYEADGIKQSYWFQSVYQWVHTDVGLAVLSLIALCVLLYIAFKLSVIVTSGLYSLCVHSWFGRKYRAIVGRYNMRKRYGASEKRWIADRFTDVLEEGRAAGFITAKRTRYYYGKIGKALNIHDLIPKDPEKSRMFKLKAFLKKKHAGKIVELAAARKEREKKPSLKDRLALARAN